jgi:hypothetical protein
MMILCATCPLSTNTSHARSRDMSRDMLEEATTPPGFRFLHPLEVTINRGKLQHTSRTHVFLHL